MLIPACQQLCMIVGRAIIADSAFGHDLLPSDYHTRRGSQRWNRRESRKICSCRSKRVTIDRATTCDAWVSALLDTLLIYSPSAEWTGAPRVKCIHWHLGHSSPARSPPEAEWTLCATFRTKELTATFAQ